MHRLISLLGIPGLLLIAFLFCKDRRRLSYKTILAGLGLQFFLALIVLCTRTGHAIFYWVGRGAEGLIGFTEAGARFLFGDLMLVGLNISPYEHGNQFNHAPTRPRRLLLHRREIERLIGLVTRQRFTLVPLSLYLKRGKVKVELGVCRGKQKGDKRETLRRKTAQREADRAMARSRRR